MREYCAGGCLELHGLGFVLGMHRQNILVILNERGLFNFGDFEIASLISSDGGKIDLLNFS